MTPVDPTYPRFTYDEDADAIQLYLTGPIGPGEVARSALVPLVRAGLGGSIIVDVDEGEQALGVEFLGVSRLFTTEALEGFRANRSPFATGAWPPTPPTQAS